MRVLTPSMTARPMAPRPTTVYWSERVRGWWPGLDRHCHSCIGGRLDATPEGAPTSGPGEVACMNCGRIVAEVLDRRPPVITAEQWRALPAEQGKRGPKAVTR